MDAGLKHPEQIESSIIKNNTPAGGISPPAWGIELLS
jgi:hypothetical protein